MLGLALLLEWGLGDPASRWHPVAWFGRWAAFCERLVYADSMLRGILCWFVVVSLAMAPVYLLHTWAGMAGDVLLLWLSLGWKSLLTHVRAVLEAPTLDEARAAVRMIVSRDSEAMDEAQVRRAALESLAENASDAVLAPLFWFVLFGPLGAAGYRMVNTLDAMWGYRNVRYRRFGCWAARVDDVMNYVPARLTALLLLALGRKSCWRHFWQQAASHASPNAGWPEAALAWAADVRLGGDVWREGRRDARPWYGTPQPRPLTRTTALEAMALVRDGLLWAAAMSWGLACVCQP